MDEMDSKCHHHNHLLFVELDNRKKDRQNLPDVVADKNVALIEEIWDDGMQSHDQTTQAQPITVSQHRSWLAGDCALHAETRPSGGGNCNCFCDKSVRGRSFWVEKSALKRQMLPLVLVLCDRKKFDQQKKCQRVSFALYCFSPSPDNVC